MSINDLDAWTENGNELENFYPYFKENDNKYYYFMLSKWLECDEDYIQKLWFNWVSHPRAYRYFDKDGFLICGFLLNK